MIKLGTAMAVAALMGGSLAAQTPANIQAIVQVPTLSQEAAVTIGETCMAMSKKNGWREAITILNARGQVIYFNRVEGTHDMGMETSLMKAQGALFSRRIGRDIGPLNPELIRIKNILMSPGGIPIMAGRDLLGAVGVGGGISINDHECGMAGLTAVGLAPKEVPPAAVSKPASPDKP